MVSEKLLSIIVNVTNLSYFEDCFNSVLKQSIGFDNLEVILIDHSENISKEHENVKVIPYCENTFAEDVFNCISNLNSDYVIFFEGDVEYSEDAFKLLYDEIRKNDLDVLSFNYSENVNGDLKICSWKNRNIADNEVYINNINEKTDLLELPPSIFTKIFKKDFIINNEIKFTSNIFKIDLLFITECLLKSKATKYINEAIVIDKSDSIRLDDGEKLQNYMESLVEYYGIVKDFNVKYTFKILENFWIKNFCLCELASQDKVDLLMSSKYIFRQYKLSNIAPSRKFEVFVDLINSKKYWEAVNLSNFLALDYPESREDIVEIIKDNEMYFIYSDFDIQHGGTGVAVINRANALADKGYNITLLSADRVKNYKFIKDYFYESGILSEKVKIVNIYEYYSDKNTLTDQIKHSKISGEDLEKYEIKKVENNDNSITYEFYDDSFNLIKKEIYVGDILIHRDTLKCSRKEYFTPDGYKYLDTCLGRKQSDEKARYFLNNRETSSTIEFTIFNQMVCYFVNEYCNLLENKPFIVYESLDHGFNINRVNPDKVLKMGAMHGNPYVGEHSKREINQNVAHLKILDDLKALVLLTDTLKEDLLKEFDYENFKVVPNIIPNESLEYDPVEKDVNKIGIFARIAHQKNITDAIKAFKIVSEKNDTAILEIYGRVLSKPEIEEHAKLEALVKELNLEDRVVFKGFIADVGPEMRKCLCTLLVSHDEGLAMSFLESMANSTPVLCYDLNYGPRDVITNGVDGIVVEWGDIEAIADNILDLIDNPQKAVEMGKNARENIKNNFTAEVVAGMWEDLLVEVYAKNKIYEYEKFIAEQNYPKVLNEKNKLDKELKIVKKEKEDFKKENKSLKETNTKIQKENDDLHNLIEEIMNSKSWKMTKPMRDTFNLLRK